jgi:hypothetical protein
VTRPLTTAVSRSTTTTIATAHVTLTLTFTGPRPSVTVGVGSLVEVVVPAWHYGSATDVTVDPSGVLQERSSVLRTDGSRLVTFTALRTGVATLAATITPASNLFMPAWGGRVVVTGDDPARQPPAGSSPANRYPWPPGAAQSAKNRSAALRPPRDPSNGAPKLNTPPSEAASQ